MKIVVTGCGKTGLSLVKQLVAEGHEVTVVDKNAERLKIALSNLDVMSVPGDGVSSATLKTAGIEAADLLIAVMDSDEMNLLSCVIAQKVTSCKTIARVRNPIYNSEIQFLKKELGISMIFNPEMTAGEEIARIFNFPYATKIDVFSNRKVEMVHFRIKFDSLLSQLPIYDIRAKYRCEVLVCTVTRGEKTIIPDGNVILQEGDQVGIVGARKDINDFFKTFGGGSKKVPDAMLVGGGKIGYFLGKRLIESGIRVKIVESNKERCEFLAGELPEADIIYGDGTDKNLLMEEGLANTSGFAALTSIDEENILLSLFAIDNVKKTITKINRINFDEVVDRLNLDTIVNPNKLSNEMIVQFIRSAEYTRDSAIENYRKLGENEAEALEFVVKAGAKVVDIPLMQLQTKKNTLICSIMRDGQVIIPSGRDSIQVGDRVIIVHADSEIHNIDDILA